MMVMVVGVVIFDMDMFYTQDVYMSHGTEYVFSINGGWRINFPF
jgi:hypothetical protein